MKGLTALLLLAVCSAVRATECPAPGSTVELFGMVGKNSPISMTLTVQKDRISGSYAYARYDKKIILSGGCTAGSLTLQESTASGKMTGSFQGSFTKPQIVEGTWSTPDGKKSLPFHLQALLSSDHISGKYRADDYRLDGMGTGAQLAILLQQDGQLRIQGNATWLNSVTGNVHTGQTEGTAKLQGDKADYLEQPDDPTSCRFTIHFSKNGVTVTDANTACGGMNVTFNGTYDRVGPPTFDESQGDPR